MLSTAWALLKDTASGYSNDNALSRGAAIAYYTVFSLAPVLVIVIAIAGFFFGYDTARGAMVHQLSGLMGRDAAETLETMIKSADVRNSGFLATALGAGTLILTASGVFSEMQAALNTIWKVDTKNTGTVSRMVRARAMGLGLVLALGFLLLVSLAVSAALQATRDYFDAYVPGGGIVFELINLGFSFLLITLLFAAIYKLLPDAKIRWNDVLIGAVATAFLFDTGKYLISLYIGRSGPSAKFGGAGALAVVLLWIYYSSQLFLFGAEFTRAYAARHGNSGKSIA